MFAESYTYKINSKNKTEKSSNCSTSNEVECYTRININWNTELKNTIMMRMLLLLLQSAYRTLKVVFHDIFGTKFGHFPELSGPLMSIFQVFSVQIEQVSLYPHR